MQDLRKKRDEERQKQLRWREEHRNALLAGSVTGHDSSDTGGGDSLPPGGGTSAGRRRDLPPPPPPPPAPPSPGGGAGLGPGALSPGVSLDSGLRTRALYGVQPGREQAFRQKQWRQVRAQPFVLSFITYLHYVLYLGQLFVLRLAVFTVGILLLCPCFMLLLIVHYV